MADSPSTSAAEQPPKGKKLATGKEPIQKREPFKPAKYGFYEHQLYDYVRLATKRNVWYYRDRLNVPRGPCSLPVLKEAWVNGVIDGNTLIWGQGLADFIPVKNVRTLVPQIRTVEVQVATWMKKTFALKPALERARKQRADQRLSRNNQIDTMF